MERMVLFLQLNVAIVVPLLDQEVNTAAIADKGPNDRVNGKVDRGQPGTKIDIKTPTEVKPNPPPEKKAPPPPAPEKKAPPPKKTGGNRQLDEVGRSASQSWSWSASGRAVR